MVFPEGKQPPNSRPPAQPVVFAWFLACGLLVFSVFSHYFPILSGTADIVGRVVTAAFLLLASQFARRSERLGTYWQVLIAFFVALAAISVDFYLGLSRWIIPALGLQAASPAGYAIEKLESSVLSIAVVLLLTKASGDSLRSLYLRRGRLRLGLTVGLIAFMFVLAGIVPITEGLFNGKDLSWARFLPWTPWVLVFVLANAFNEELLFRGLFFGKLEPLLGRSATNVLIAIPFTLMHVHVQYTASTILFIAFLFPLSLAWGYTLQKTDGLWGSVLFHAAMDIPVILGILSRLP